MSTNSPCGPLIERLISIDRATPMLSTIMHGWKKCFSHYGPRRFQNLIETLIPLLRQFHEDAVLSAGDGIPSKIKDELDASVQSRCNALEDSLKDVQITIKSEQKEINRVFAHVIRRELTDTYQACAQQVGKSQIGLLACRSHQKPIY